MVNRYEATRVINLEEKNEFETIYLFPCHYFRNNSCILTNNKQLDSKFLI